VTGASEPVWLGVDIGTQGCRGVAVDSSGRHLAAAEVPLAGRRQDGRHEQDPLGWVNATFGVLHAVRGQLTAQDGAPDDHDPHIGGLAICATSGTMLVADDRLHPLTAGIMYDDARAAPQAARLGDVWAECAQRNGYHVQPTWALPKLAWCCESQPSTRAGRLFHVADYVGSHLAGVPLPTDSSHALKSGYDLVRDGWPAEEFERAGIPATMLPPVARPGTVVGGIGAEAAELTGIPIGTPIVAGMTDGCASQIAAGTVHVGQWNSALGTTLVLKGVSRDLIRDPDGAVYSHRHPDGGWFPGGASSSGSAALAAAFPGVDPAELDRWAEPLLPTEVIAYPLASRGERFPFVRPDAEPFRSGMPGSEAELAAALLQGVAFVERLCLSHLTDLGADTSGTLSFTGGATASGLWNQLRADVLGREIRLPLHPEAAAGMAIVAAAQGGSVADAAGAMVTVHRMVEPRADRSARWHEIYLAMVDELERRGYIRASLASAARAA
jgi:sugar (pentulose or hexulose) kinase